MEEVRLAFNILTSKPEGNRPLRCPRRRWENSIRIDLKEIGVSKKNHFDSALDRY